MYPLPPDREFESRPTLTPHLMLTINDPDPSLKLSTTPLKRSIPDMQRFNQCSIGWFLEWFDTSLKGYLDVEWVR
jgi:hypothetical protein